MNNLNFVASGFLKLHALNVIGQMDSEEADKIRDTLDDPWYLLNDEEQTRINKLSVDLYKLTEDLIGEKDDTTSNS